MQRILLLLTSLICVSASSQTLDQKNTTGELSSLELYYDLRSNNYEFWEEEGALFLVNEEPNLIVEVNKTTQTAKIIHLTKGIFKEVKVSTGGGLKIPVNVQFPPYCADTPKMEVIVPIRPFDGKQSNRYNATVFQHYVSGQFDVDMPYAIRIKDGIFIHQVPRGQERNLGKNVSGDCIRIDAQSAKELYELALQEKYIKFHIYGDAPDPEHKRKCEKYQLPKARAQWAAYQRQQGIQNPWDTFIQWFGGDYGSSNSKPRRSKRPADEKWRYEVFAM